MLCALYCDEAPACNSFRIDSGTCTFGFLPPTSSDDVDDTQVEVYVKSRRQYLDKIAKKTKKSKWLFLDGQLSSEVGCYKSDRNNFGWHLLEDRRTMTMAKCMNHCKTYQNKLYILGGLGNYCYCANSLPESALLPGSKCTSACSGEPGTEGKCGGNYKWNVHAVLT